MKRTTKIGITILAVILAGLVISAGLNTWMTALVCRQLDQNISSADSLRIEYGDVKLTVLAGKAWIKNVHFCTDTLNWEDSIRPGVDARVDMLSLDGINYYDWLVRRQLRLKGFTITNPTVHAYFNHKTQWETGEKLQEELNKERDEQLQQLMEYARIFVDDAVVERITIDHANIQAEALNDSMLVCIPECTFNIYDLGYNIKDQVPHYNDSVFHFLINDIEICIPEVQMNILIKNFIAEPNGVLQINDATVIAYLNANKTEKTKATVKRIGAGGFDVAKYNTLHYMDVKNIHIYDPHVQLQIDESGQTETAQQRKTEKEVAELNQKILESNLKVVEEFIKGLVVDTIVIHNAGIDVLSISSSFKLQAAQINTAVYGLGFSLIDEIPYHYNDSVFQFSLGQLQVVTPNQDIAISTKNMHYDNGGAFSIGKTHIKHLIDRWELARFMGEVPSTWMDLTIDSLHTSSKNIVKEAFTLNKNFFIDTIWTEVNRLSIFRDARWKEKEPYLLPQMHMLQVEYPFTINHVIASVRDIHIEMALTQQNVGKLDLGPIQMHVSNVSSITNSVMSTMAKGKMGTGDVMAKFDLTVNPNCDWHIKLLAEDLNTHHLDSMIYPLVGMTIGCAVHRLRADYGGNAATANGTICMEYDSVDIHADKNSNTPFKVIGDMSGLINSAGKTLVHQANPSKPGKDPMSYQITWQNDPWANPSMFYLGPVIDGCVKNFLPGLFISKRVKEKR